MFIFCVMELSWLAVSIYRASRLTADHNDVGATRNFCFTEVESGKGTKKNILQKH